MKVLKNILNSEKTNLGKLELIDKIEIEIVEHKVILNFRPSQLLKDKIHILGLILDEIKTKPTWGKNQLKDLFLDKILDNL